MKRSYKNKQGGFVAIVGTILGMAIISAAIGAFYYSYKEKSITDKGKLAGEQIRILGQAVDEYISINRDKIANLQSDDNIKCQNNKFCTLSVAGLKNSGELPNTFSEYNTWGSTYKILIKREGNPPDYKITGVVVTSDTPTTKPLKVIGYAVQTGGANAGNNLTDIKKITGNSGLWSYTNRDFHIISDSQYQLAYRVGYNASQYSPYLRRDGSLPMTGALDMDRHSIRNADHINANNLQINDNINTNQIHANQVHANQMYTDGMTANNAQVNNNININGKATMGALHVNGDAYINGKLNADLIPKQVVAVGQNCSPNGLIAKLNNGKIVSCVDGRYGKVDDVELHHYGSVGRGGGMNMGSHAFCAVARVGNAEDGHYCQVSYDWGSKTWWKWEYKTGCQAYCMN